MSIYLRKSLRAGPFRFNLSKSGVGVSAGITGFRLGTGPRGNYVHMGRHGLYYRSTLPGGTKASQQVASQAQPKPFIPQESSVVMTEIDSANVLELRDSSSADLLDEMNGKHKKLQTWPIATGALIFLLFVLVSFALPWWVYAIVIVAGAPLVFLLRTQDQIKKTTILFYELEQEAEQAYQCLHDAFQNLSKSNKAWHISASGQITNPDEQKRNAGAGALIKRKGVRLSLNPPPYVSSNLAVPSVPVGKQTLYFFPDRILVYESGRVGAVSYTDLQIEIRNRRFIEEDQVPNDAQIVDRTWKYVNKKGGPDKRFKDNRQLPVCLYSEIHFTSQSGLNELVQISKPNTGDEFEKSIQLLKSTYQGNQPEIETETQVF
jgi:hypothetical protein